MDGYDILNVKSAVKSRSYLKWERRHLTTTDIGQIMVPFNEELVPGDDLNNVRANFFARLAPLVKPTYGKCDFKTAAFFVPYHQIAEDADAWMSGSANWQGQTPHQRWISASSIVSSLYNYRTAVQTLAEADFVVTDASGVDKYWALTAQGRYYVKIFNSLGYCIPQGISSVPGSYWQTSGRNKRYSAYPLLAFFKAYNDWMSQSQRFNTSQLSEFLLSVRQGKTDVNSYFDASSGEILTGGIILLFSSLKLNYENDYFTSAWQNANTPLAQSQTNVPVIPVNSLGFGQPNLANLTKDFTVLQVQSGATQGKADIPALGLQFLKSFDDWVRRNNYSGSRIVQQIYSRFGIKTDDYKTHYAHLIKTTSSPLMVGDIMATADTTGAALGEYAGKGIVSDDCNYSYKCSDYGLFIVLSWISVTPMNSFGFDRKVLRTSPFDYYNPEFDGIGADPISFDEVFVNPKTPSANDTSRGDSVYGFTERYNSYRSGYRDQITGDFRFYDDMDVWHFGRDLTLLRASNNMVAQSDSMNTLSQTDSEYDRIFGTVTQDSPDHFYFTCKFDVDFVRPMMNFNEVTRLGVGDTSLPRNGNTVN